ncbi:MAG TPA: SPFH domain-containing protein [Candidatus Paceibacterota bacterium]|nr:SPFH domain-containing protein [Candidatus Paceibacterota bacterium]
MNLIRLFRSAGATGHVFFLKNGTVKNMGLAYSGFIGPKTTVAVVPTIAQSVAFAIDAQTQNKQNVTVSGTVSAELIPETAVSKLDFTVETSRGGYTGNWTTMLHDKVAERVLRAVLEKIREIDVETATHSQKEVETAVTAALGDKALEADGIKVVSCSIPTIEADDEVAAAIGATERQTMLTEADKALHDRRLKASQNDRTLKEYEADTRLELEKKQGALLDEQAKNKKKEAETDAAATRIRLEPIEKIDAGKLLGAAVLEGFKNGRVNSVVIGPELLGALQK